MQKKVKDIAKAPLSGTFSKATVALNAERFNSSCFSNSCFTELGLTFCCIVARNGSTREFRSIKMLAY